VAGLTAGYCADQSLGAGGTKDDGKTDMNLDEIMCVAAAGESETVELKKSTAELSRAAETLCAFLNGQGGQVLIGVSPAGKVLGQQVSDSTLRDVAVMLNRFEPPVRIELEQITVDGSKEVLVLSAPRDDENRPFVWRGRPYQRVGTTTSVMPQERYERLLLDRGHVRRRWENQPAEGVALDDLDREEILRTRELAIQQNRVSAGTSLDPGEVLDRLKLRQDGRILQAAQMLYGTRFSSDYPQALLKLGRFRGTTITGDILDNRQDHMHAFVMVREAMAWLERTMPLSARFPVGRIEREDRFPVPTAALREAVLNAVMHRDYSDPSGYVAIAVFDDRVEVRSIGQLPTGITAADLSGPHPSKPPNPLIAEAFHRTGAVEVWGRGTNRVIDECLRHGIEAPTFEERSGSVTVTFRAEITPGTKPGPSRDQVGTKSGPSSEQIGILKLAMEEKSIGELMEHAGRANRTKFRDHVLRSLLDAEWLEMTIPEKPRSSKQRYRTTAAGRRALEDAKT